MLAVIIPALVVRPQQTSNSSTSIPASGSTSLPALAQVGAVTITCMPPNISVVDQSFLLSPASQESHGNCALGSPLLLLEGRVLSQIADRCGQALCHILSGGNPPKAAHLHHHHQQHQPGHCMHALHVMRGVVAYVLSADSTALTGLAANTAFLHMMSSLIVSAHASAHATARQAGSSSSSRTFGQKYRRVSIAAASKPLPSARPSDVDVVPTAGSITAGCEQPAGWAQLLGPGQQPNCNTCAVIPSSFGVQSSEFGVAGEEHHAGSDSYGACREEYDDGSSDGLAAVEMGRMALRVVRALCSAGEETALRVALCDK